MLVDSPLFLLAFLPILLGLFTVCPRAWRDVLLLAASLLFYALTSFASLPLFAASMAGNMILGLAIERASGYLRSTLLALGVAANLTLLAWSKYLGFLTFQLPGLESLKSLAPAAMPLGVSFFTFTAVAYLMDIARGSATAEKNPVRFGLFMAFFPKITAGPIARHADMFGPQGQPAMPGIADAHAGQPGLSRSVISLPGKPNLEDLAAGLARMAVGLAKKKVLVAGAMAPMADAAFGERAGNLDMGTAWLGLLSYALQLYFDFSGYTDMAVGLGRMFGYRIPENFNYPYVSQSVREFWRRWHITLSSWFRDYLYIPLGGGRVAPWKVQRNLLVVFVLCGLWHGASWNFVIWGLWHGLFLALERTALGRAIDRLPRPVRHVYALAAVGLGWVFFRAPNLTHTLDYFMALAGYNQVGFDYTWMIRANRAYLAMLALGILGSAPALPFLRASLKRAGTPSEMDGGLGVNSRWPRLVAVLGRAWNLAGLALPPALLTLAILKLAAGTYTPFIYAQF